MDDFPHPDVVRYQIRSVVWEDTPSDPGVRSFVYEGIDTAGDIVHRHPVEFDGNPHYPTLEGLHDVLQQINAGLLDGSGLSWWD